MSLKHRQASTSKQEISLDLVEASQMSETSYFDACTEFFKTYQERIIQQIKTKHLRSLSTANTLEPFGLITSDIIPEARRTTTRSQILRAKAKHPPPQVKRLPRPLQPEILPRVSAKKINLKCYVPTFLHSHRERGDSNMDSNTLKIILSRPSGQRLRRILEPKREGRQRIGPWRNQYTFQEEF